MAGSIIYSLKKGWFGLKENVSKCHPKSADSHTSASDIRVKSKYKEALAGFRLLSGKFFHFAEQTELPEMFASD